MDGIPLIYILGVFHGPVGRGLLDYPFDSAELAFLALLLAHCFFSSRFF